MCSEGLRCYVCINRDKPFLRKLTMKNLLNLHCVYAVISLGLADRSES